MNHCVNCNAPVGEPNEEAAHPGVTNVVCGVCGEIMGLDEKNSVIKLTESELEKLAESDPVLQETRDAIINAKKCPVGECPGCGEDLEGVSAALELGDVLMCSGCSTLAIVLPDLKTVREALPLEAEGILSAMFAESADKGEYSVN